MGPVMMGGFRPPRRTGWGMSPRGGGGMGCGFGSVGCLVLIILFIVVLVFASVFVTSTPGSSRDITEVTKSTIEREPLPPGSVTETGYYTDELDWIKNPTKLTAGMKNFYQATGVQPYLYITDTIEGSHNPSEEQVERFAMDTYDDLFSDEAHLLLIFFEYDGRYHTWYLNGIQAKTVLDQEAMDILLDYVDKYYYYDITEDEMFSKAFDDAGTRIMEVTTSPWIPVLIVAGILGIFIVTFIWWQFAKKQKNKEAQQTQEILNTPLEAFGSGEAEDLAKKYEEDNQ